MPLFPLLVLLWVFGFAFTGGAAANAWKPIYGQVLAIAICLCIRNVLIFGYGFLQQEFSWLSRGEVGESMTKTDGHIPPIIKQVSSEAILAAQEALAVTKGVASEFQHVGV
ncbi:Rubber elongation factor [Corchorus olitorius]|uniref:Rubber elongation factor n=1 Tax=Corchorus olitorius TaxID=93759 RepID=A0A1R3JTW0_9ROSI|nr:Rubber elongation factor [Corchorus olitorius]